MVLIPKLDAEGKEIRIMTHICEQRTTNKLTISSELGGSLSIEDLIAQEEGQVGVSRIDRSTATCLHSRLTK